MAKETFEANSVLGIDIGSNNTRAILFDVVEDSYHFIASGIAPSSHGEPYFDIGQGVFESILRLQETTGRMLLDNDGNLLIPSRVGGEGVDRFVVTISCSSFLKIVTFGLLNDVSLSAVNKLAYSIYGKVVESIGINDRRPQSVQLDAVLAAEPDLILFAGGTDDGASRSILRMSSLIANILEIMHPARRPRILYCGNAKLGKRISDGFSRLTQVKVTRNIHPTIDDEVLEPALKDLDEMVLDMQQKKLGGLDRMAPLCSTPPIHSNQGFHDVIRFLGRQYDPAKGVLAIDIGGTHSVAAYANHNFSTLHTLGYGLGTGISSIAEKSEIKNLMMWLDGSRSEEEVMDYLWQRSLYPNSIASNQSDLDLELAATRHILRLIMNDLDLRGALPSNRFEPILISGSALNRTITPEQSLLVILDGVQPLGICPLILDKHGMLALLGAAGRLDPLLPVQVLESTAFTNLATVINAVSSAKPGSVIMQARLVYANGSYLDAEIKQGSIISLPLASGEAGELQLKMLRRTVIEEVNIFNEPFMVRGGVCGVVIDARERPLRLPENAEKRRELFHNWKFMLGGK